MERLTEKHFNGEGYYMKCSGEYGCIEDCGVCVKLDKLVDHLAAYENTGLTPEDMYAVRLLAASADHKKAKRIYELRQADDKGLLVVLPCKFGDALYRIRRFKRGKNWTKEAAHILTTTLTMNNVAEILFGGVMGKSVFLTREEAEAALKGGADE